MGRSRGARDGLVRVALAAMLLATGHVPTAAAAEPVGASLQISWTRPGTSGTLAPPSKLRVGDTVTIRVALTGFTQAACDHLFHHLGTDAHMGATQSGEASIGGVGFCRPWTFVVPPAPAGTVNVHVSVSGDDTDGGDASATPADVPLALESGGSHRPFTSTYPTPSWAPIDVLGTATPTMGVPMVFERPPGATRDCAYELRGDWTISMSVSPLDRSCSDWSVNLPDLRPAAVSDHPEEYPWLATMTVRGGADDPDTGATLSGYAMSGPMALTGNGSDAVASNLPAVVFPDATNPRYVVTGTEVTVRPQILGVTDPDAVCRTWFGGPEDGTEMFSPVVDGTCESVTFDASAAGSYPVLVQLHSGDVAGSYAGHEVWAIDEMPAPSIDAPTAAAGTPFDVTASVSEGLPSAYEFIVTPSGGSSDAGLVAPADGVVAASSTCSSGALDFLEEVRTAKGRCTVPAAGTYTLVAAFTDVTGALRVNSRAIVVADPADRMVDIGGHPFEGDIRWLYSTGITRGCAADRFCPDGFVTRAQMASFLVRALSLPTTARDYFRDDERSAHEGDINRLRAAGITGGCAADRYCPDGLVTRAQMASFLVRALSLPLTSQDYFADDERSPHESDINRLRAAAVTGGCAPGRFCPAGTVTRGQMAAFLRRALD